MVAKNITRMKNAETVLLNLLRECNFNIHNITGQQEPVKRIKTLQDMSQYNDRC